jgi:rare lipoprotein A
MKKYWIQLWALVGLGMSTAAAQIQTFEGDATVFSIKKYGKKTRSGEYLSSRYLVGSHAVLPVGSIVEVEDPQSKRSVTIRLNDEGTSNPSHSLELSHSAAQALGMTSGQVRHVKMRVMVWGNQISERQESLPNTPKAEPLAKKTEFPMDFPHYEKIPVDTSQKKN